MGRRFSPKVSALLVVPPLVLGTHSPVVQPAPRPIQRLVAITIDDLPAVSTRDDLAVQRDITRALLGKLVLNGVQATGFVNESKLYSGGSLDTNRVNLLREWITAGQDLGNHSFSHLSLYRSELDVFQRDVLKGEQVTRPLLESYGRELQYFRHPFLNTGPDLQTKQAFEAFLVDHGYRVAPVTIDNQEWIFARAYDRALDAGDESLGERLAAAYVAYMDTVFGYYEQQSRTLLGYEPPQVLLIHANRLNAHTFTRLADVMRHRHYRFVALDRALQDHVYERQDDYVGPTGITWLHRWAITDGMRRDAIPAEPTVPAFVVEASGLGGS